MNEILKSEDSFHLIIKRDTLYVNSSGNVIGVIFFKVNGFYFPENNWHDFVVRLISWLTESTFNLKNKIKENLDMPFMEGCYKVEVALDKNNLCKIDFIEGEKLAGDKEIIHKSISIPLDTLINEVKKACETLLTIKNSGDLDFKNDYEELKKSYELLCKS
jgi:hypothetical protein